MPILPFNPRPERPDFVDGAPAEEHRALPATEAGWQRRYNWLHDQYMGERYSSRDHQQMRLFKAFDADGELIHETQRITGDIRHVVDTDIRAIAAHLWTLAGTKGTAEAWVDVARRIWLRSRVQEVNSTWAMQAASMGDTLLEAVRTPQGVKIVGYDPRHVQVEYDEMGTELVRALIRIPFFDMADPDDANQTPMGRVYIRELTRDRINVWEMDPMGGDGAKRMIAEQSGPHGLGVVPAAHIAFLPSGVPEHGLWAAPGLERVMGAVDSLISQLRAVANRYGNPTLAIIGATADNDDDIQKFGRVVSGIPEGGDVKYVEAGAQAISGFWQAIREYRNEERHAIPEFLFSGSGANTSGRALDLRANEYRLKMEEVRTRFFGAVARVTEMALSMEAGAEYDPTDRMLRIIAPPVLPIDRQTRMRLVTDARAARLMTRADAVRQMQALGLVDESADPIKYVAEIDAEDRETIEPAAMPGEEIEE